MFKSIVDFVLAPIRRRADKRIAEQIEAKDECLGTEVAASDVAATLAALGEGDDSDNELDFDAAFGSETEPVVATAVRTGYRMNPVRRAALTDMMAFNAITGLGATPAEMFGIEQPR